jgi:hypothetical protein
MRLPARSNRARFSEDLTDKLLERDRKRWDTSNTLYKSEMQPRKQTTALRALLIQHVVAADVIVMPRSCSIQSIAAAPSWTSPIFWLFPVYK